MLSVMATYPNITNSLGGVENYIAETYSRLADRYSVRPIFVGAAARRRPHQPARQIQAYLLRTDAWFRSTPIGFSWFHDLKRLITQEKPDVINGHLPIPGLSDVAARVAKSMGIPFVLTYHNDVVGDSFLSQGIALSYYAAFGLRTLALSESIIATSHIYARSSPFLKPYANRIRVAQPGIKDVFLSARPRKSTSERTRDLLFVGRLDGGARSVDVGSGDDRF
jgi:glycosyltransferase involved in cell wall biosynthesis